ncbi:MAG: hypothetical protein FWE24_00795 [Defluviitaleaceae bacterium]|nr:hypothetical protein [Defluviitaleaceae bacterium]
MAEQMFRKIAAYMPYTLILILLTACTAGVDTETDNYISSLEANERVAEETAANDNDNALISAAAQMPFNGEAIPRTDFFWQEERDLNWESDIRHFGVKALRQYPLLIDFDLNNPNLVFGLESGLFGIGREDYDAASNVYNILLRQAVARNGILADGSTEGMREAFREFFIQRVNELIFDIPNLSDNEILFGLAALAVSMDDAHTRVGLPTGDIFPVEFISLHDGIYFIGVPIELEHALYGELVAINGIAADEIVERLGTIVAHGNEYYLRHIITSSVEDDPIRLRHYVTRPFLREVVTLNYLSVIDDSGMADFTIRGTNGEIFDIRLQAVGRETIMGENQFVRHEFSTLMHTNPEEILWYEYFPDENLMYVRITGFHYAVAGDLAAARSRLMTELENWSGERIGRFVIDLRQNAGGLFEWPTDSEFGVLSEAADSFYVLIDAGVFSLGVLTTSNIRRNLENVTVVGEPAGDMDNMMAGDGSILPNSRMRYNIAQRLLVGSDSEDVAVRPDIFVPLSIDDIINGRDPVIEAVKETR